MKAFTMFIKIALVGLVTAICLSGCAYTSAEASTTSEDVQFENITPMFSIGFPSSSKSEQKVLEKEVIDVLLEKNHKSRNGEDENYKLISFFQKQKEYALILNDESILFLVIGPDGKVDDFVSAVDANIDAGVYEDPLYRDRITERK